MNLIQRINTTHGLSGTALGRSPSPGDPLVVLRGKLERACERLSKDLYNTKTHFLLEFIQNADDNNYNENIIPSLHLCLGDREMIIKCNEKGFSAANVEAICDVGGSTKTREKQTEGYIGEKGIGFKAVFVVARRVHVASREYTFRFDRDGPLGMINPIWDPSFTTEPGWTTFRLDIAGAGNLGDLSYQIGIIQPSLLLFLRKLRSVNISVETDRKTRFNNSTITICRQDEPDNIVRLERHENGACISSCRYIVFKQMVRTFTGEEKRQGIEKSEVVLAFPVADNGEPLISEQYVHAFLPVAKYGLSFVVQADFLTPSSREGIVTDSRWNLKLFDGIAAAFVNAVDHFQRHPVLRDCWMRFLPIHAQSPFAGAANSIYLKLQARAVLRSMDGVYRRPEDIITISNDYRIDKGEPIIPPQYLSTVHYIHSSYDVPRDRSYLTKLGVTAMSDQHLLDGLKQMDQVNAIPTQDERWHDVVCASLSNMPRTKKRRFIPQILDLRILPLNDGTWGAARAASLYVFVSELDVFEDINLRCIRRDVKESTVRHSFFQALGVRRVDATFIANKMLESQSVASWTTLIRYARFFYDHGFQRGFPNPSTLKVVDEQSRAASGDEVYIDVPAAVPVTASKVKLREVLPSSARFLHPAYTQQHQDHSWTSWLHDSLGVRTSPRIISGKISPEIQWMARMLDTQRFLAALRAFWPQISKEISQAGRDELSQIVVACEDGTRHALNTTAVRRQTLARLPTSYLHFIAIPNANDPGWNFLGEVGVMTEPNPATWIKILVRLQEMNSTDEALVTNVYKQLDARFDEAAQHIRAAFNKYTLILVSSGGRSPIRSWVGMGDAYWDGPSSVRSKFFVKSTYDVLEDFFRGKLGLRNAPLDVLVDELDELALEWNGRVVTEPVHRRVERMLVDISECITRKPSASNCLYKLKERAIFPVYCSEGRILLEKTDRLFVSEKGSKSIEQFREYISILAVLNALTLNRIQPILHSSIWNSSPRILEASLFPRPVIHGQKALDPRITELYVSRSEYVERYLQHKSGFRLSSRQEDFLAKMDSLSVYVVDSISIDWMLDGKVIKTQSEAKIGLEETSDRPNIFVSKICASMPRSRDREICSTLGDILGTDKLVLVQLVEMPLDDLLQYLEEEGITFSADELDRATMEHSWLQDEFTITSATPQIPAPPTPMQATTVNTSRNSGSKGQARRVARARKHDADLRTGLQALRTRGGSNSLASGRVHHVGSFGFNADTVEELAISSAVMPRNPSPAGSPKNKGESNAGQGPKAGSQYQETDYDRMNGILGEFYVYEMLRAALGPIFSEDDWTSELRGEVSGFTAYSGPSLADFRCVDSEGVLTGLWYGEEKKETWRDHWPTYHIEVKATSGPASEPFHMSRSQLHTALHLHVENDAEAAAPVDVYAIIRVWNIRSQNPKHDVYLDPHRWIYDGGLVIDCSVDLVPHQSPSEGGQR